MLDTNVLISGFAFGSTRIREMTRCKDFAEVSIEKPEIMTPAQFMHEYLREGGERP